MGLADKLMDFLGYERDDDEWDEPKPQRGTQENEPKYDAQIVLLRLEGPDDARYTADLIAERRTVIFSITGVPRDTARRLIDFVGGAVFTRDGQIEHIATDTYLVAPFDVELIDREY